MVPEVTKTYHYRKVMKPLLERKRRARINKCLDDLKDLMVECLSQEGEHVTRLEKADILELTVEHMRKLKQRGDLCLKSPSNTHLESFRWGYVHAADHISHMLQPQSQTDEVSLTLMKFLSSRLSEMQQPSCPQASPTAPIAVSVLPSSFQGFALSHSLEGVPPLLETPAKPHPSRDSHLRHECCHSASRKTSPSNESASNCAAKDSHLSCKDVSTVGPVWRPW